MEKFMQRENVYLGLSSPNGISKNSSKTSSRSSSEEMDFNDVFGGPPRRFSMQEGRVRYSFGETSLSEEKPVFGEDSVARRRHQQGDDFFDDIFKGGDQSAYSSLRRSDNVFGSSPSSRIMSPARPLPPKAEPFGTSLPAQFSLPAKLTKATEYPMVASPNHGQYSTNGLNGPHSSSSLSRFSNQAIHQSPFSHEASLSTEDAPSTFSSHQNGNIEVLKKDTRNLDSPGNQFHFSIYKWESSGVPMLMPLAAWNNLKSKDNSNEDRRASSNESEFLKIKRENEDLRSKEETKEVQNSVEEAIIEIPESKSQNMKEEQVKSLDESDNVEKMRKEVPLKIEESLKSEVKPPGNLTQAKESKTRTPKGVHATKRDGMNVKINEEMNGKKNEGIAIDSNNATVEKSSQRAAINPRKSGVKGKVREFVQIFNQEAHSRTKPDILRRSPSSRWRPVNIDQKENEVSSNSAKANQQVNLHKVEKKPDDSLKVDENLNNEEARRDSPTKTPSHTSNYYPSNLRKSFSADKLNRDSKMSVENSDDLFEYNFLVEKLSNDHEEVAQSESSDDTKAIDAKLKQWSSGKKGNIHSLLSTLQYVLWPGSGWKPVPLADLIEANSVKRAYQRALLCLHPDKLQQKGAAFHQKYIAEKVFDILQEAWDHFNALDHL